MRLRALFALALVVVPAWAGVAYAAQSVDTTPTVDLVEVPGVIDPPFFNYIHDEIVDANRRRSSLVVLELDSAGTLDVSLEKLLSDVAGSRVPIAVWVGPQHARAASGAAMLVAVAHVAGMSPQATVGPVNPTDLGRSPRDRSLRTQESALLEALGARGAVARAMLKRPLNATAAQQAGVVRIVTPSLADFVRQLDGVTVTTAAGTIKLSIKTSEVTVVFHKPGPIRRFLHVLTSATLVYLLIVVGAGLVVFEIFQPGFGVAGVTGALMLAAAGYGLSVLPFSWWALALVAGGLGLLTLDVALHGLGVPTGAGVLALVVGSVELVPVAALRVPVWMVVVAAIAALIYFVPVMTVVKRNRRPVARGATRALVGQYGEVRSVLNPEGFVWVSGGLWRARSEDGSRMRVGEPVEVTGLTGDVLTVRRSV